MRYALACVLLFAGIAAAQHQREAQPNSFTQPTPKVGQRALQLTLSTASVKVFRVHLAPHEAATISASVRDYMLLAVSGGAAEIAGSGNSFPVDLRSGDVQVFKGGWPHQIRSRSETPTQWVIVELSRPLQPERATCGLGDGHACSAIRFGKSDAGEYSESVLFETPAARVLRAELAAESSLPTHGDHLDHLVVPMSACNVAINGNASADNAGDPFLVRGGTSDMRNAGGDAAKFVIVEIK